MRTARRFTMPTVPALVVTLALTLALVGFGATTPAGATATHDRVDEIHYSYGDSADSVVFDWRGQETRISYGTSTAYGSEATAGPPAITPADGPGPFREVRLSGLRPGTTYHYRIGTGGPDHTFRTVPTGDFSWVDVGDTMSTSCHGQGSWMPAMHRLIAGQHPDFVTHGGDIADPNQCGLPSLHRYYVDQQVWSTGAAFQPAWGNHEYGAPLAGAPSDAITDSMSNYKGRSFVTNAQTVPGDGPRQLTHPGCGKRHDATRNTCPGEDWGWFRAGHVLFISYPEVSPHSWTSWQKAAGALMQQAQTDPDVDFVVTWGHRPPYTSSTEGPNLDARAATQTLARRFSPTPAHPDGKYVLSVGHHAHSMEAFRPITGLTYVVAASGGQGLTDFRHVDAHSAWRLMHLGILSATYDASAHRLDVSMVCGAVFPSRHAGTCSYGETLWSTSFTR